VLKRNGGNFKALLVSEKSQSEKATFHMISSYDIFGHGKTVETVKRSVVVRG
jgi:hypothetical protein